MIAILHSNGLIAGFINNVTAIEGEDIQAEDGGARGVGHDVIVVEGWTYGEEVIPPVYEEWPIIRYEDRDGQIVPVETTEQIMVTPEQRVPYITDGTATYKVGDTFAPSQFTDVRDLLPESPEQKIARLESELAAAKEENLTAFTAIADLYEMVLKGGGEPV